MLKKGDTFILTKEISDAKSKSIYNNDVSKYIGKKFTIKYTDSNSYSAGIPGVTFGYTFLFTIFNKPLTPNNMSITDSLRDLSTKEPQKTYVKLGVTDKNGQLTAEGSQAYIQHQFDKESSKDSQFFKDCQAALKAQEK